MQITFTGHHIEITPAVRAFTLEKMKKLTDDFDKLTHMHVTFRVEKLRQIVDVTAHVDKIELHANAEADVLYTAIDEVTHKLYRQLEKHKGKILDQRDHRHQHHIYDDENKDTSSPEEE